MFSWLGIRQERQANATAGSEAEATTEQSPISRLLHLGAGYGLSWGFVVYMFSGQPSEAGRPYFDYSYLVENRGWDRMLLNYLERYGQGRKDGARANTRTHNSDTLPLEQEMMSRTTNK